MIDATKHMNTKQAKTFKRKLTSRFSDDPQMHELIKEFVGELPRRVLAAQQAFDQGEYLRLQVWAHQMKGGAGGYGFQQITDMAAVLEKAISTERPSKVILSALLHAIDACERAASD